MPPDLLPTLITRTEELATALEGIGETDLLGPSALPDWSRLTIAAHLRYGAVALHRMTLDVLDGRPTAYYPLGREAQRPGTLSPAADETPRLVLRSLREESDRLHERWSGLSGAEWSMVADEPLGNPDLGPRSLHELLLLRCTEVEVHGTDLDLGLAGWTSAFVAAALPFRLQKLDGRPVTPSDRAGGPTSWRLEPELAGPWLVEAGSTATVARPAAPDDRAATTIRGADRDLLALLLARPDDGRLEVVGDPDGLDAFRQRFPGP